MTLDFFRHEFRTHNGLFITPSLVLFRKPLELYDMDAARTLAVFDTLEDALNTKVYGISILSRVLEWPEFPMLALRGGRGSASSGDSYNERWKRQSRGGADDYDPDFASRMNVKYGGRNQSYEDALLAFVNTHAASDIEHGVTVDEQGFTTRYVHGGPGSVAIAGTTGETIIHNHPSDGWPTFSREDIESITMSPARSIVAVSSKTGRDALSAGYAGTYTFTKGSNFNASGLMKALSQANLSGKNYNDAVSNWLTKNANKYGYTYTYSK